jgi:hypothetical protein
MPQRESGAGARMDSLPCGSAVPSGGAGTPERVRCRRWRRVRECEMGWVNGNATP